MNLKICWSNTNSAGMRTSEARPALLPIRAEILFFLSRERGRAIDIANATGFNQKSVWHALQALAVDDLVVKDKFDVYQITEKGKVKLRESNDSMTRKEILLSRLSRRIEKIPEKELEAFTTKVLQSEEEQESKS